MPRIPSNVQAGQFGSQNPAGRRRARPQPVVLLKGAAQGLEHTDDRALDAIQRRVADASGAARANPLASCNFIQNLSFVGGVSLIVQHGLGRAFVSAFVCGQSVSGAYHIQRASAPVRPPSNQNILDTRQVVVTPNFTGTADLLVW